MNRKVTAHSGLPSLYWLSLRSDVAGGAKTFAVGCGFSFERGDEKVVTIKFSDRDTEKQALGFLIGRFSGRVLRSGEHLVPEAALEALAEQNIPFMVQGETAYEQQIAALRGDASASV
jgi:hypothetical protein